MGNRTLRLVMLKICITDYAKRQLQPFNYLVVLFIAGYQKKVMKCSLASVPNNSAFHNIIVNLVTVNSHSILLLHGLFVLFVSLISRCVCLQVVHG